MLARRDRYHAERNQSRLSESETPTEPLSQTEDLDLENLENVIAPKKDEEDKTELDEVPELENVDESELIEVKINNQSNDTSSIFSQKSEPLNDISNLNLIHFMI